MSPTTSGPNSSQPGSPIPEPSPTARAPMARSSATTAPCSTSGLTPGPTDQSKLGPGPSTNGSTCTTITDTTPPSGVHPSAASTTWLGRTTRPRSCDQIMEVTSAPTRQVDGTRRLRPRVPRLALTRVAGARDRRLCRGSGRRSRWLPASFCVRTLVPRSRIDLASRLARSRTGRQGLRRAPEPSLRAASGIASPILRRRERQSATRLPPFWVRALLSSNSR
jgi:hypothetical protein